MNESQILHGISQPGEVITFKPLIRRYTPSIRMAAAFHARAAWAETEFGDLPMPSNKPQQGLIDPDSAMGVPCLTCFQASRHQDDEFAWSALWVLRSVGHVLHVQCKRGSDPETIRLHAGCVLAFDSRLWHWTTGGHGMLVVGSVEFENEPSETEVTTAFSKHIVAHDRIKRQFSKMRLSGSSVIP